MVQHTRTHACTHTHICMHALFMKLRNTRMVWKNKKCFDCRNHEHFSSRKCNLTRLSLGKLSKDCPSGRNTIRRETKARSTLQPATAHSDQKKEKEPGKETSTHVTSDHRLALRIMPWFKDLYRGCRVMAGWHWRGQWPRRAASSRTVLLDTACSKQQATVTVVEKGCS